MFKNVKILNSSYVWFELKPQVQAQNIYKFDQDLCDKDPATIHQRTRIFDLRKQIN